MMNGRVRSPSNGHQCGPRRVGAVPTIDSLHALRGIAAAAVMLLHLQDLLPGLRIASFTAFFDTAFLAVDLFFILSGIVMAHVYGPVFHDAIATVASYAVLLLASIVSGRHGVALSWPVGDTVRALLACLISAPCLVLAARIPDLIPAIALTLTACGLLGVLLLLLDTGGSRGAAVQLIDQVRRAIGSRRCRA